MVMRELDARKRDGIAAQLAGLALRVQAEGLSETASVIRAAAELAEADPQAVAFSVADGLRARAHLVLDLNPQEAGYYLEAARICRLVRGRHQA